MSDVTSLLMTGLAFFAVAVSPGPANLSNATIAMSHGRKASMVYGLGLSFGLVFWGVIAASGMGAVLQSTVYLLSGLKLIGGLYLLWLAYQSAAAITNSGLTKQTVVAGKRWFIRGLLLNITNPKSVIAWMAALSVGLHESDGLYAVIAATSVCSLVGFTNNMMYSLLFSVNGVMRLYQRFAAWVNGIAAGLFLLAGLALIRSALSR